MFDAPAGGPADQGVILRSKINETRCPWLDLCHGEVVLGPARSDAALDVKQCAVKSVASSASELGEPINIGSCRCGDVEPAEGWCTVLQQRAVAAAFASQECPVRLHADDPACDLVVGARLDAPQGAIGFRIHRSDKKCWIFNNPA